MNITVFCGSSNGDRPEYIDTAVQLGEWIGRNGHTLVFGGSGSGIMGAVCKSALENGAKVIGVEPEIQFIRDVEYPGLTEVIYTNSMAERKKTLSELGGACIILPGGFGTLDEAAQIMESAKLGKYSGKIAYFNLFGFYDDLLHQMEKMVAAGFVKKDFYKTILVSESLDRIKEFITE